MPTADLLPTDSSGTAPAESAFVILRIAGRAGPAFQLDPGADNIIGRGSSSLVVLADRVASRRHAVMAHDATKGAWTVRDLESRNGTWLDGVQIREATLTDGHVIRIGTTELEFRTKLVTEPAAGSAETGRLVRHGPPDELQGAVLKRMAASADEARWPMLLYQSGIRLLASKSSWQVVCTTLELATEFMAATRFGWFTLSATGDLRPVCVVPPGNGLEPLLTGTMARELSAGRAAWVSSGTAEVAAVPVFTVPHELAVLVAAAPPGALREADFDVLVTLASLAAASGVGASGPEPGGTDPIDEDLAIGDDDAHVQGTIALSGADLVALGISPAAPAPQVPVGTGSLRLVDWQRALVVEALRRANGSVPDAAATLGISRATLYRKLDAWGLTPGATGRPGP